MRYLLSLLVLFCATVSLQAAENYKYADLVGLLTNLERLAEPPVSGEIAGQQTSYDRASKYDEATDKYIAWDANGDGEGVIETYPDGSVLMADIKGPGVINHIWSALALKGHVKIFLDGNEVPAIDLPFEDYFSRKVAPFDRKELVYKTDANGLNNWVPIPFQKSCKIIGMEGWGRYFYFQYVIFPEGTKVPVFSMNLDAEANAALDKANEILANCGPLTTGDAKPFTLAAKEKKTFTLTENSAITGIRAKIAFPEDPWKRRDLLRSVTLSIYWDGSDAPAVWAPIGDFFGTATEIKSCLNYPTGLTEDGLYYANWFMPYEKATIVIENEGTEPAKFETFDYTVAPLKKSPNDYLRFHAKWHRNSFEPPEPERASIDWSLLFTEGMGKYVGVSLHIENFRGDWWGEGDEKFHIDGEKFPSYFGTGSEDYFGYAWSSPKRFIQAFHAQPTNDDNRYYIVNNRWHVCDAVLFRKSFEGYIEKYFRDKRHCFYAATAFWYLAKGGVDPYEPWPLEERIGYNVDTTHHVQLPPGGIPFWDLYPRDPKDRVERLGGQGMGDFGTDWFRDNHVFWTPQEAGKTAKLRIPAPEDGTYKLSGRFTKARNYGIFQLVVNGKEVGKPVDLFGTEVVAVELEVGVVELKKGDNELLLKNVGKNERGNGYAAGINYLVITKE